MIPEQTFPVEPWHVRMTPYPFGEEPLRASLLRRVLPKNGSVDVLGAEAERVEITVTKGLSP